MEQQIGNATIFDVAKLCGVSRGTVDRVLHRRGRVSQETVDKVNRAIEILGYKPNANASLLASKRVFTFSCLIPNFNPGEYWEKIYEGFKKGASDNPQYHIDLDFQLYDQTDIESFKQCCENILELKPAGVVMSPVFEDEVKVFAHKLEEAGIPYAFVDNNISDLDYVVYCGADAYKSGEIGAFLLTTRCDPKDVAVIRLIRDSQHRADPNYNRRRGFFDFMTRNLPDCKIHYIYIKPENPQQSYITLKNFFDQHPEVNHVININSRTYLIGEYLRSNPNPARIVIGFDNLERNLDTLRSGNVEYLVTRQIHMQSYLTLISLAEYIISGKLPEKRDNYLHMEILHRITLDE